jgi:hypothetical protein
VRIGIDIWVMVALWASVATWMRREIWLAALRARLGWR